MPLIDNLHYIWQSRPRIGVGWLPVVYLFDNCAVDQGIDTIETFGQRFGRLPEHHQVRLGRSSAPNRPGGPQYGRVDRPGIPWRESSPPARHSSRRRLRWFASGLDCHAELRLVCRWELVYSIEAVSNPRVGAEVARSYGTWPPGTSIYDDLRGVDALAVVGNAGFYMPNLSSGFTNTNASDGLVSLTSASLGFAVPRQSFPTRVVPYCHIDPIAFTNANLGTFACNAPESPMSPARRTPPD